MITFNQFLQILSEKKLSKKQQKEISKGIVVKPETKRDEEGVLTYNLANTTRPVPTNPGSAERKAQINIIQKNSGAKAFNL